MENTLNIKFKDTCETVNYTVDLDSIAKNSKIIITYDGSSFDISFDKLCDFLRTLENKHE